MVASKTIFLLFLILNCLTICTLGRTEQYIIKKSKELSISQECNTDNKIPWRPINFVYPPGILGLHTEIEHFYKYVQPTPTESALRKHVIAKVNDFVKTILPQAQVQIFGSFVNGLSLPNSDIDFLITGVSDKLKSLRLLESELFASDIVEPNSLKVKDYKIVPIVKFTDRESKIGIDLPFGMKSALEVPRIIDGFQRKYPDLSKLLFVLKQLLKQRKLNRNSTGMTSYPLLLMCISFFQLHYTYRPNEEANFGEMLLNFFDLYGRKFDYEHFGITIRNGGAVKPRTMLPCQQQHIFCIEDPIAVNLNVCSNLTRSLDVKHAFNDAYVKLSSAISLNQMNTNDCAQKTALSSIIQVSDEFVNYRKWIEENFTQMLLKNNMQ